LNQEDHYYFLANLHFFDLLCFLLIFELDFLTTDVLALCDFAYDSVGLVKSKAENKKQNTKIEKFLTVCLNIHSSVKDFVKSKINLKKLN